MEPRFFVDAMLGKLARWLALQEALPLVPPLVRGLETPFGRCRLCDRLYWNGTHTDRIVETIRRLGLS